MRVCGGWGDGIRQEPVAPFWFRQQEQNITIPEDVAPGSKVVQVQTRGSDVRYEIVSPAPCRLFSIGRGETGCGAGYEDASEAGSQVTCIYLLALLRQMRLEPRQKMGRGRLWEGRAGVTEQLWRR